MAGKNSAQGPKLLTEFVRSHGLTPGDIARRISPFRVSRQAVVRWMNGSRTPRPRYFAQIERITDGDVPANSWLTEEEMRALRARKDWLASHPHKEDRNG